MSKKRQRRVNDVVNSYDDALVSAQEQSAFTSKENDDLFVVDRAGSKNSRRRIQKEEKAKTSNKVVSKTERVLIEKISAKQVSKSKVSESKPKLSDIWGEDESTSSGKKSKGNKRALKLPPTGFSYNPSAEDHQEVVAEAVALTIKHEEELLRAKTAFDREVSETTALALTAPDDSDSDNSDGSSDSDGDNGDGTVVRKGPGRRKKEKLTRAQRNKIRERNISTHDRGRVLSEKQILKELDALPKHIKAVDEVEKQTEAKKAYMALLKENAAKEPKGMSYAEAECVPLSDELGGSLRTIVPKGRPIVDHTNAMRDTGDLTARDRKRRKKEQPHAGKKVKWFAKHKY